MLDYLSNLYSQNMDGATYTPFTSLDVLNSSYGNNGGSITSGDSSQINTNTQIVPPPTPTGADIKLFLDNIGTYKNQITFNVQGQSYNEGSVLSIDSNTINDSLVIKPIVNDGFTLKNYFELKKTLVNDTILIDGVYEPTKVPGITLITYNGDGSTQATSDYALPQTIDLGFDLTQTPTVKTFTRIQNVYLVTNYNNTQLNSELEVTINSVDLVSPKTIRIGDSVDITNVNNTSSDLSISISGLSSFDLSNIRWQYSSKFNSNSTFDINDFNILTSDNSGLLRSSDFNSNIILLIEVTPNTSNYPTLTLGVNDISYNIAESVFTNKSSKLISIPYNASKLDGIKITTPYRTFTQAVSRNAELDLQNDFQNNEGQFKILLTPYSELYGDGVTQSIIVTINKVLDTPIIDKIDYPTNVVIPVYSFGDTNFTISFESNLATNVFIYHSTEDYSNLFGNFNSKDSIELNYNSIKSFNANAKLDLLLVPYNGNIKGEIERISILFDDPGFYVSTQNLKDELFNAIASQLKFNLNKPNYLNHLASFDIDDKQIIISNWDTDNTTFTKFKNDELGNKVPDGEINKSIVLKLYEPLPTNINKNDLLWVSELVSLPILQSVIVSGTLTDNTIPLRPANFNIEVDFVKGQSTGFQSYDGLILSGSQSSQQIVDTYLVQNFIDIEGINIDYTDFSNFVKYSSAVERLANFKYKKDLIDFYDNKIEVLLPSASFLPTVQLDIINYENNKNTLINGFDNWEKYLQNNVFTGSISTNDLLLNEYNTYLSNATIYDKENVNSLKSNIPNHIIEDSGNLDFLLFLDMIGNYFDIIWSYINGISDQKKIAETNKSGIEDKFLYQYLESFGWDAKNLNSNKQLWNYVFGLNDAGLNNTYTSDEYLGDNTIQITPEQATNQVWRRIANNLPYLLKHRGSVRGINALLTCYGIASSNLSIMEFGGPTIDTVVDTPKFIYDSLTYNLVFDNKNANLIIPFNGTPKPQAIEFKVKPAEFDNYGFINSNDFQLGIVVNGHGSNKFGNFTINHTQVVGEPYPFYDGNYHSILVNKVGDTITLYAKTNDKDRIIQSGQWSATIDGSLYESTTQIEFVGFSGSLEEFRLWQTPLSESVFDNHVIMPEAINGNTIYSSTEDLLLRLDFERAQDLSLTGSINNVAPNLGYIDSITTDQFGISATYPYNYEPVERELSLIIPNSGASRYYTNKVRLESQELISNLSPTQRATKKAFETSTKDSNRVGLLFSPNKDLDLDIAKSLGGESFDDYIGDPQYEYGYTNYPELDTLRNYYFERVGERNIYEFIRLVKFYDKSLFVNLKEMLPARANVTTGLLIAPHLLERNKINVNRPKAEAEILEGVITDTQFSILDGSYEVLNSELNLEDSLSNISIINEDLPAIIDATETYIFNATNLSYKAEINTIETTLAAGEVDSHYGVINYKRISSSIQTEFDLMNAGQVVGMDQNYIDYGFNTMFDNGYGKYTYEENGIFKSKGVRAFLVTKRNGVITKLNKNGVSGSEANIYTSSYTEELLIQDIGISSGSLAGDPNIVSIVTASGYLPSHYIYKGEKHTGIQNLFFRGSKQTSDTTIDGKSPVETFVTNPTKLRVTAQGRSNNEPILEVD